MKFYRFMIVLYGLGVGYSLVKDILHQTFQHDVYLLAFMILFSIHTIGVDILEEIEKIQNRQK